MEHYTSSVARACELTGYLQRGLGGVYKGLLVVLLVALNLLSCRQESNSKTEDRYTAADSALHREWKSENFLLIDSAAAFLEEGDIALRLGADATSEMLRGMNQKAQDFSHCGIVAIEEGQKVVYHSIGGEDNPDARMRRERPTQFFHPLSNMGGGIYRIPLSLAEKETLLKTVRKWYAEGRGFDMAFNLETDTALYCAEMVYKAYGVACRQRSLFTQSRVGRFVYVAVDDLYTSGAGRFVYKFGFR